MRSLLIAVTLLTMVILSTTLAVCSLARPQSPEGANRTPAKTENSRTNESPQQERLPATSRGISPLSCSSTACHGQALSKTASVGSSNSFDVWLNGTSNVPHDPHVRAYDSLRRFAPGEPGYEMARQVSPDAVNSVDDYREFLADHCNDCHVTATEQANFDADTAFGVSCESCHGDKSEAWLYHHTLKRKDVESTGFRSLETSKEKMDTCRDCHVGRSGSEVNHELIAAGHPRLNADLADYLSRLPKHWNLGKTNTTEIELWFVGQQEKLDRELELLANDMEKTQGADENSNRTSLPDFARMDCYACHHTIQDRSPVAPRDGLHAFGSPTIGSSFDLFLESIDLDGGNVETWRAIQRAGLGAPVPRVASIRELQSALAKAKQPTRAELLSTLRSADVSTSWDSARGWWHAWSAYDRAVQSQKTEGSRDSKREEIRQRLQGHFEGREYPRRTRRQLEIILSPVDFDMQSFLTDRETAVSP